MTRESVVLFRDDLDGSPAATTVVFAYAGIHYEIDLSESNAVAFDELIRPYLGAARRRHRSGRPQAPSRTDRATIRTWALANGHRVGDRGRIPDAVIDAFDAFQTGRTPR